MPEKIQILMFPAFVCPECGSELAWVDDRDKLGFPRVVRRHHVKNEFTMCRLAGKTFTINVPTVDAEVV